MQDCSFLLQLESWESESVLASETGEHHWNTDNRYHIELIDIWWKGIIDKVQM
jgi:hypothetical protein